VRSGGQRFAIPQLNVKELVRTGPTAEHRVQMLNDSPVLRLRDGILPLVSLADHLRLPNPAEASFVVVMDVGGRRFGVGVDGVYDTEEIVVKPLAAMLKAVPAFSGATILGDGSVVLIIDPNNLSQAVGELAAEQESQAATAIAKNEETTSVLVFHAGDQTPKAVPVALVTRLEEVSADSIEFSSGRAVVQYRGQLMPLVHAANGEFRTEGKQPVLVFTDAERVMGLAVDQIVDIVNEQFRVERSTVTPGVLGTAVLKGRATDVVDVAHYLTKAFGDWFDREAHLGRPKSRRVLLVDDNAFFRNMIAPLISAAGYEVTPVGSAQEAWRLHGAGESFDAIVSDIEMPDEDGFDFARKLSEDGRWAVAPRIALTGLPVAQTLARAPEGAFLEVVRKSDRDGLLKVLDDVFQQKVAA
jgi:two-component system chemotaxis sensor kinase CheA